MSSASGPNVSNDGLVFTYDMSNSKKSWKGAPTTNLLTNGHFENGNHVSQFSSGGSYGSYQIDYFPENPGNSDYVLRQNGGSNGEYEMGVTLSPSTTYCVSCWVAYTPDSDMSTQILHTRWYYTGGNSTTGGAGTLYETKQMGGFTWERRYVTFTTSSTATGSFQWYLGYSTGGTKGFRYLTDLQIEAGTSVPTPFVNGTRSNTQAILDLTNNNTVTASSLTYAADGTFSFNGSNFFTLATSIDCFNKSYSLEAWVKRNTTGTTHGITGDVQYNWFNFYINSSNKLFLQHGYYNPGELRSNVTGSTNILANTWYHVVGTFQFGVGMKLYVNGQLDASNTNTFAFALSESTRGPRYYGRSDTSSFGSAPNYFNGSIDNFKGYSNKALTATEVQQNFQALRSRYGI
jgi:hypothetical protein